MVVSIGKKAMRILLIIMVSEVALVTGSELFVLCNNIR